MKGLFMELPPFSPDYSGVASALFELGGMIVIHGADGCIGNYIGYDEPRWYGESSKVFSTGLREIDTILGDEDRYIESIKEAIKGKDIKFLCILGTPPPMVIGTDFKAIEYILKNETGLDVYSFDTNGINYYDVGASKIFVKLAEKFIKSSEEKVPKGLNIIGAQAIDIGNKKNVDKLEKILKDNGFNIVSNWCMKDTYENLKNAGKAEVNLVISVSGIECAEYMYKNFNIPYYVGLPIGEKAQANLISTLKGESSNFTSENNDYRKVLIIGEQVMSNSIRNALKCDKGFVNVDVASFFTMKENLMDNNDTKLNSEDELLKLSKTQQYDIVIADPLYKDLIDIDKDYIFIKMPHIAVSSRLYWDNYIDYLSVEGLEYIEKFIK